jgi:hypothetical protein
MYNILIYRINKLMNEWFMFNVDCIHCIVFILLARDRDYIEAYLVDQFQ